MRVHDLYPDMDPDYRSRLFQTRKKLLGSLESPTLLPENGLSARKVLNDNQYNRVKEIRQRRFAELLRDAIQE